MAGVDSILEDRAGNLWLGTMGGGLLRLDRERRRFVRYRNHLGKPDSLAENHVALLRQDRQGNIWANLRETGVSFFGSAKPLFKTLWQESGNPNSPNSRDGSVVKAIHEDRQGTLWMGTEAALIRMDRKTGQHSAYRSAGSAFNNNVISIGEDSSGGIWAGTYGQGLKRLNRAGGQLLSVRDQSAGVAIVRRLLRDRNGGMWALTEKGLMQFAPGAERLTAYL